jgi:3'-5' exonuclease
MDDVTSKLALLQLGYPVEYVDCEEKLGKAVNSLSSCGDLVFDCEGDDLSRTGALTVATFGSLTSSSSPIYVVDVQVLGPNTVFSKHNTSFRTLLEDEQIPKIMFDCRSDSDALFHQYGVRLSGVQDMQILDQAARIMDGAAPPHRCPYLKSANIPRLPGMDAVSRRCGIALTKLPAPHGGLFGSSNKAWSKRPLPVQAIAYAAQDVYIIKQIYTKINSLTNNFKCPLGIKLENAARVHAKRYEGMYRDREKALQRVLEKDFVTEEHAIVTQADLPALHPNKPPSDYRQSKGKEKWDDAIHKLRHKAVSDRNALFSTVLFILQHDDWYTDEALTLVRQLSVEYPNFTSKQRAIIHNPPALPQEDDYDEYYDDEDDYGFSTYPLGRHY